VNWSSNPEISWKIPTKNPQIKHPVKFQHLIQLHLKSKKTSENQSKVEQTIALNLNLIDFYPKKLNFILNGVEQLVASILDHFLDFLASIFVDRESQIIFEFVRTFCWTARVHLIVDQIFLFREDFQDLIQRFCSRQEFQSFWWGL
jgi:hypothetical protein